MTETWIERIFDTQFKRRIFREIMFFEVVILALLASLDINRDVCAVFVIIAEILYSSMCDCLLIKDIDLRYDKSEEWEKYRMELKIYIAVGVFAIILALWYLLK